MFKSIFNFHRERRAESLETAQIKIKGMTCRNCVQTVKRALLTKNGVTEVRIDLESGMATITYDSTLTNLPVLHEIILRKGYFPDKPVNS
ncbi:MAG: Heavy metal transport/detoxification protein [Pedosphaera sp.]|nr:Heavy metal transport/detoxification protein [Pedosphaera sp.]